MKVVSKDSYGPKLISDTLFFSIGGAIKNVHKKTAKIDQKW